MSMDEDVPEPNWTIVPPGSPLVGLLAPLQLAAFDHAPPGGPIHVCVAPSAGPAPKSVRAQTTAIEITQRRVGVMACLS
jgi:hypothetical protein